MAKGFAEFEGKWGENALLAWDALSMKPTRGIPHKCVHTMDIEFIEDFSGHARGEFRKDPEGVYLDFQRKAGACSIDQYIPTNPLTMGDKGFEAGTERKATTGLEKIVCDGIEINSPEAVIEHMEKFVFPAIEKKLAVPQTQEEEAAAAEKIVADEVAKQRLFGPNILKVPYRFSFPGFLYGKYGYQNYFMAYALYPEVMEKYFRMQADVSFRINRTIAKAVVEGGLPKVIRLDHDMADSKGTLVRIESLDKIWFPHFRRAIQPLLDAGIRLLWHCDGNLMQMVPRLIEAGVSGFQGFQYEDGMDYEKICRMKDRNGNGLIIWAGVSVTRTLPFGTTDDVRKELRWLADNGPKVGLFLGASSSITPGTNRDNLRVFIEGLEYYRTHGRG